MKRKRPTGNRCLFCHEADAPGHLLRCPGVVAPPPPEVLVNALRDAAMAQVGDHAEMAAPGFRLAAAEFVLELLTVAGPTPAETLSLACKAAGIVPHDDRAFGPVYMRLARARLIEKVGQVRRERGHGTSGGNIWKLVAAPSLA